VEEKDTGFADAAIETAAHCLCLIDDNLEKIRDKGGAISLEDYRMTPGAKFDNLESSKKTREVDKETCIQKFFEVCVMNNLGTFQVEDERTIVKPGIFLDLLLEEIKAAWE